MKQDVIKKPFDKVMMTGVFVGIIITVISIFFDGIFVESTNFPYTSIINVSSLIFGINLLFLVVSIIYYAFTRLSKYGNLVFIVLFALITILLLFKTSGVDRTNDIHLNSEFRELLSGIIILTGIGAILIPFLLNNEKFRKNVI